MSPFVKVLLVVAVIATIAWVLRSRGRGAGDVSFTPVEQLHGTARGAVDTALDQGHVIAAVKAYRDATGAGLQASKVAVQTYQWKREGGQ